MPDPPYDIGDVVRVRLDLSEHQTGSPLTPSSVALWTRTPAGTLGSYAHPAGASAPVPVASNIFTVDVLLTTPGVWQYRWIATSPMTSEHGTIPVATSVFS